MQPPPPAEAASSGAPAETSQETPLALRAFEAAATTAAIALSASRRSAGTGGYLSPRQPRMFPAITASEVKASNLAISHGARLRASSQGAERQALMSSSFVERQRETTPQRGGTRRLSGGGYITPRAATGGSPLRGRESLYLTRVRAPRQTENRSRALGQGSDALPSDAMLQEVCDRRLQSLRAETEQLQSKTIVLEREIRKVQNEKAFEVLKSRNTTPGMTPAMSPSLTPGALTPGRLSPRAPMTPNVPGTPPWAPPDLH